MRAAANERERGVVSDRGPAGGAFHRIPTGVDGLDTILYGGLPEVGVYLVKGGPGTGKTTLGLQFLRTGVERGESCLFISLSQSTRMLQRIAASHGWTLDGIDVHAITPREVLRRHDARQDIFVPDEVELVDIADRIRDVVAQVRPRRLVFDSLSFVEVLATTPGRFEHELAALVEMLGSLHVTALFVHTTDEAGTTEMIADGAITLEHLAEDFGGVRYRLRVEKVRASTFRGGNHDFEIVRGGLRVYPRLTLSSRGRFAEEQGDRPRATYASGIDALDEMAGGGLAAGTSCLIEGPSGAGKSSLATRYVHAAAEAGHRSTYVLFEEVRDTFLRRSAALGMDLNPHLASERVRVLQVGATSVLPGQLANYVRDAVDGGAAIVVVDSLSGYHQSLLDERLLLSQIRDTIRYLSERGVVSIVTSAARGCHGEPGVAGDLDIRESVDVAIDLRYVVAAGAQTKGLSVVKRRDGGHATTLRELIIDGNGVRLGALLPYPRATEAPTPRRTPRDATSRH
jgi:circadian clock protein KaiC